MRCDTAVVVDTDARVPDPDIARSSLFQTAGAEVPQPLGLRVAELDCPG